ncbi:MAG: isochorismatase family protein [Bdellovibrionales bacterium]|jgi:nicotinamidase-related amidase|nr:isochorismatase family protein [Bdellovibrionales bacterium]
MNKPEALLINDIQQGFMKNGAEAVIDPIATLVESWPQDRLFYLRYRNYPGSLFARHLDWHEFMTSGQVDIVPKVYVEGAPVFEHYGYRPPDTLIEVLSGFETVGICGVDTDACVMAAVFALWDAEIRPVVLADYCMSSGGRSFHNAALDLMLRQFGTDGILRGRI